MRHILLVEDNPDDEALTIRALKKNHMLNEVTVARDGAEALKLLFADRCAAHPTLPGLVLLDLSLPKVEGLEVLRQIRAGERTRLIPVVILTTSKEQEDILAGYANGANAYVRKPLTFADFTEAMNVLGMFWLLLSEPPPEIDWPSSAGFGRLSFLSGTGARAEGGGQPRGDGRADSGCRGDIDGPASLVDGAVDTGEAESAALDKGLGREERLEHVLKDLRLHACAAIADDQAYVSPWSELWMSPRLITGNRHVLRGNRKRATVWHGPVGVPCELQDDLLDLTPVSGHGPGSRCESHLELDVRAEGPAQQLFNPGDDLAEVDELRADQFLAASGE
jgi:two-component system, response regulator